MDILSTGGAASSGGILGALLAFFGIKQHLNRQEKELDVMKEKIVWKEVCQTTHKSVDERLNKIEKQNDRIENKVDILLSKH